MADDKKIIFSMVGVSKMFPPHKQVSQDWTRISKAKWYSRRGIRWGISNKSPNSTLKKQ